MLLLRLGDVFMRPIQARLNKTTLIAHLLHKLSDLCYVWSNVGWTPAALIAEDTVNICVLKDPRPTGAFARPGEVYLGTKVFWKDVFSWTTCQRLDLSCWSGSQISHEALGAHGGPSLRPNEMKFSFICLLSSYLWDRGGMLIVLTLWRWFTWLCLFFPKMQQGELIQKNTNRKLISALLVDRNREFLIAA